MLRLLLGSLEGDALGVIRALVGVQIMFEPVVGRSGILGLGTLVADGALNIIYLSFL